jgi:hypothetical protein
LSGGCDGNDDRAAKIVSRAYATAESRSYLMSRQLSPQRVLQSPIGADRYVERAIESRRKRSDILAVGHPPVSLAKEVAPRRGGEQNLSTLHVERSSRRTSSALTRRPASRSPSIRRLINHQSTRPNARLQRHGRYSTPQTRPWRRGGPRRTRRLAFTSSRPDDLRRETTGSWRSPTSRCCSPRGPRRSSISRTDLQGTHRWNPTPILKMTA